MLGPARHATSFFRVWLRLSRHLAHREAATDYHVKSAQALAIQSKGLRDSYSQEIARNYLRLMGSPRTLEEIQKAQENVLVSNYEDFIQSRLKLNLREAGDALREGMLARLQSDK